MEMFFAVVGIATIIIVSINVFEVILATQRRVLNIEEELTKIEAFLADYKRRHQIDQ